MKITEEMVFKLNNELIVMGCPFRYSYTEETVPSIEVQLLNTNYLKCYTIYPSDDFLEWLYKWFEFKYGIELECNNTGTVFWSKRKSTRDLLF